MECILIPEIKLAGFRDLFIIKPGEILQDQCATTTLIGAFGREFVFSLYSGAKICSLIRVKIWSEKDCAQDFSSICCFLLERNASLSKRDICCAEFRTKDMGTPHNR